MKNEVEIRIIGGMFGLKENLDQVRFVEPKFMRKPSLLFLNARCAIKYLIDSLKPPQVWMPSYLCCSMIDAVDQTICTLKYFPVGFDLRITNFDWLDQLIPGSLVILIDYFGFPCDMKLVGKIQDRGSLVLEDASQALLSTHVGLHSDFILFSPRKFVGVPDGGILRPLRNQVIPKIDLSPPPHDWWLKALEACILRREFDRFGGENRWFKLFRQVEETFPLGQYCMSELSEMLINCAFDYQMIAYKRRDNYAHLAELLSDYALYKQLDDNTVPLGFPIKVKNRERVRQFLFEHEIYPPIHWNITSCIPVQFANSHKLGTQIMTIPCDQRLESKDITRMIDLFLIAVREQ